MTTKIRYETIDISQHNKTLDLILMDIVDELDEREKAYKAAHPDTPDIISVLQTRFNLVQITSMLAQNLLSKTRKVIEKADTEMSKTLMGFDDGYTKR